MRLLLIKFCVISFCIFRVTELLCGRQTCPIDLITPPDDCHVNYTLSFSLQVSLFSMELARLRVYDVPSVVHSMHGLVYSTGLKSENIHIIYLQIFRSVRPRR